VKTVRQPPLVSAALSLPASDGPASLLVSPVSPELSRGASPPASGTPPSAGYRQVPFVHEMAPAGQSAVALHSRHVLFAVLQAGVGAMQSAFTLHWTHVLFVK
jgi:hypothetical protein